MENRIKLFFRGFLNGTEKAVPGVIYQDIHAAESSDRLVGNERDLLRPGDVEGKSAGSLRILLRKIIDLRNIASRSDDMLAATEHLFGKQAAKTGGCAGDKPDAGGIWHGWELLGK